MRTPLRFLFRRSPAERSAARNTSSSPWRCAAHALRWLATASTLALTGVAAAQTNPPRPAALAFEAATIKPTDPNAMHLMGVKIYPGGRVLIPAVSLKSLITTAFNLGYWQVTGGEPWIEKEAYDIEAKPPSDLQPPITDLRYTWTVIEDPRLREMLRALIIDRFQLRDHTGNEGGYRIPSWKRRKETLAAVHRERGGPYQEGRRCGLFRQPWIRWRSMGNVQHHHAPIGQVRG